MAIDRDDWKMNTGSGNTGTKGTETTDRVTSTTNAMPSSLDVENYQRHLRRLRHAAEEIESVAYSLAGHAQTATVSELILISAALERIVENLQD